MNANYPFSWTISTIWKNKQCNPGRALPVFAGEEEGSTICFCVHLPQEGSAICSHVCHPSWPSIHGSVPWDLLNGEEKAGVVGIWGGDVVPLLTDFVRPSLLLASAQNSCFTLGQRSLSCHTVPSQRDRGKCSGDVTFGSGHFLLSDRWRKCGIST